MSHFKKDLLPTTLWNFLLKFWIALIFVYTNVNLSHSISILWSEFTTCYYIFHCKNKILLDLHKYRKLTHVSRTFLKFGIWDLSNLFVCNGYRVKVNCRLFTSILGIILQKSPFSKLKIGRYNFQKLTKLYKTRENFLNCTFRCFWFCFDSKLMWQYNGSSRLR